MAAVGGVAYMGAKAGSNRANQQAQQQPEQGQDQPAQAQPAQGAPAAATDAATDRVSRLKDLADLKASGALTDEEFQTEKQRILA